MPPHLAPTSGHASRGVAGLRGSGSLRLSRSPQTRWPGLYSGTTRGPCCPPLCPVPPSRPRPQDSRVGGVPPQIEGALALCLGAESSEGLGAARCSGGPPLPPALPRVGLCWASAAVHRASAAALWGPSLVGSLLPSLGDSLLVGLPAAGLAGQFGAIGEDPSTSCASSMHKLRTKPGPQLQSSPRQRQRADVPETGLRGR